MNTGEKPPGVFFGDVWYEPGGELGPRVQPDFQMVIVHLGEARVRVDDEACFIPPGSVALLHPGGREIFRFSPRHPTWCAVRPALVPAVLRRGLKKLPRVLPQSRSFELLMKAAFNIGSWREMEGRRMLRLLGLALLEEYVRMAREGAAERDQESPRVRARKYLEEHCAGEDCLAGAARAAGVSPQHLIRLFRQHDGVTPGKFLWQIRVERGAGLLTASGLTVSEIADRCGFKNPFHFSRLLRKMQGISPRDFRRRAWLKNEGFLTKVG